jgi:LPS export ABC transporter protein LptC
MFNYHSPRVFRFFAIATMASLCLLFDILTRINFNRIELPKDQPEYNAVDVNARVYNKSGKLLYNLLSQTAWKYPNDERVFLTNPQLYMYNEQSDRMKYYLKSTTGWVNYTKKVGQLGAGTELTLKAGDGGSGQDTKKDIKVYGKNINFNIDKNLFQSNDDVRAVQDKNIVTARGFSYDYNKQFLTLNSKVRITYVK